MKKKKTMDRQWTYEEILSAKECYLYDENGLFVVDEKDNAYGYHEKTDEWYLKENFWDYFDSPIMLTYLKKITNEEAAEMYRSMQLDK